MRLTIIMLLFVVLLPLSGQELPRNVQRAITTYEAEAKAAYEAYLAAEAQALARLEQVMEAEKERETRQGNLREALAILERLEEIQAASPSATKHEEVDPLDFLGNMIAGDATLVPIRKTHGREALIVSNDERPSDRMTIRGEQVTRYFRMSGAMTAEIEVPRGAEYFSATGIDADPRHGFSLAFVVLAGNTELYRSASLDDIEDHTADILVRIPRGARTLTLHIDNLGSLHGDRAIWGNPQFWAPAPDL